MPETLRPALWESRGFRDLDLARLFDAMFRQRRGLAEHYPWVPVPFSRVRGPFNFGCANYPVGAVVRFWSKWDYTRGRCPECGGPVVGFAFAGALSSGHVWGVCRRCALMVERFIWGMGTIMRGIRPILAGTPFSVSGVRVAVLDDRPTALIAVLQELGESNLPKPDSPSFRAIPTVMASPSSEGDGAKPPTRRVRSRSRRQKAASGTAKRAPRRYLVKEVASGMAWTGTIWAVACSSLQSARRAFNKRVARNLDED